LLKHQTVGARAGRLERGWLEIKAVIKGVSRP
jgi:hypothetical protein